MHPLRHILADNGTGEAGAPGAPDAGGADATTMAPSFGPLAFDNSYTWMIQMLLLMSAMTFFMPLMRQLFRMETSKQHFANFRWYDENSGRHEIVNDDEDEADEEE